MKLLPLSRGQFAKVDDEDFEELNQWKWHARWSETAKSFYAQRTVYDSKTKKKHAVHMHRVIMDTPKGMKTDHIDHDTLNNQKYNLRNCTQSQNMMNRKGVNSNNSLGISGIARNGRNGFMAQITNPENGATIYLGTYPSKEMAKQARMEAELKYYGEFAPTATRERVASTAT